MNKENKIKVYVDQVINNIVALIYYYNSSTGQIVNNHEDVDILSLELFGGLYIPVEELEDDNPVRGKSYMIDVELYEKYVD